MLNIEFIEEKLNIEEESEDQRVIHLPELTEEEKRIIDPIVAPTSGLRIQIYDIEQGNENKKDRYTLTNRKLFLFLRVFKAISEKFKDLNGENLKVLIVTDNRSSKNTLLKLASEIFTWDGYQVFYQQDEEGESRVSSPYGAASVALIKDIKLVIVLTASHNDLSWNGIKFYIEYPIPISGDLFKEVSERALNVNRIPLKRCKPQLIDAISKNNEYIQNLLANIIDIKSIRNQNIVIWPYLGKAKGIVDLFTSYGANVITIDEEINPPNPIKVVKESKLQATMEQSNSKVALLLDADRDRIALYVKQENDYFYFIPNEIYSAMHNILAKNFNTNIINVRTIPSDPRGDNASIINVFTGVGYKHLGVILYFLFDIPVDQSKIDTAILYFQDTEKKLVKIKEAGPLKSQILALMKKQGLSQQKFMIVMWEESGGHTINILNVTKNSQNNEYSFTTELPLIADKYPVPALVLITELIYRGYSINQSIDWNVKGINQTIEANDEEKIKIMQKFEKNDNSDINIGGKSYQIHALSDNLGDIDIYQLKSKNSTLYFRPSGTGPEVRFYIFGKRETHLDEINRVQDFVKQNYLENEK